MVSLALTLSTRQARSEIQLPALFASQMVLAYGQEIPVWGEASPQEIVTVSLANQSVSVSAGPDGHWMLKLGKMPPGGPMVLRISGSRSEALRLDDIYVGQSWLFCDLASAPAAPLGELPDGHRMRVFPMVAAANPEPQETLRGQWQIYDSEHPERVPAEAVRLAKHLHASHRMPVGVIYAAGANTPVEAWISRDTLESEPTLRSRILSSLAEKKALLTPDAHERYLQQLEVWQKATGGKEAHADPGLSAESRKWANLNYSDTDWLTTQAPCYLHQSGLKLNGAIWFRKELELSEAWEGNDLVVSLGQLGDWDELFFNGHSVGRRDASSPPAGPIGRTYRVPGALVRPGRNVLSLRLFVSQAMGGIFGGDESAAMHLAPVKRSLLTPVSLAGAWRYKVELELPGKPQRPPRPSQLPGYSYNAMIAPVFPMALTGVVWRSGQNDLAHASTYRRLWPTLVQDWRQGLNRPDLPFILQQLPGLPRHVSSIGNSLAAEIRESMAQILTLPKTALVPAFDLSAADVGTSFQLARRTALVADELVWDNKHPLLGPNYDAISREGGRIRVGFRQIHSNLKAVGGALRGFVIAGEDHRFVRAEAQIDGQSVEVWSDLVPKPVAVRYNWDDLPDGNLFGEDQLPIPPFRSDEWIDGYAPNLAEDKTEE